MRTFIWANENFPFTEYQFFVAHAEDVEEARQFIKNQLQCDLKSRIDNLQECKEKGMCYNFEYFVKDAKKEYEQNISSIDKYEPSHIISAGMGICIHHANY